MNKKQRVVVWEKYGKRCAYCGEDLTYDKLQVDHIKSKHRSGEDVASNYNPSCQQCNFYKGSFTLDGFRERLSSLTDRIKKPFIVRLAIKYGIISFKPFSGEFYFEKINRKPFDS